MESGRSSERFRFRKVAVLLGGLILLGIVIFLKVHSIPSRQKEGGREAGRPSVSISEVHPGLPKAATSQESPLAKGQQNQKGKMALRGRLHDFEGFRPSVGLLASTTLYIKPSGNSSVGDSVIPNNDGTFRVLVPPGPRTETLVIETHLRLDSSQGDETDVLARSEHTVVLTDRESVDAGALPMPRYAKFGAASGEIVGSSPDSLVIEDLYLESSAETASIRLAKLADRVSDAPNSPYAYVAANRFAIVHVPSGEYLVKARVKGHSVRPHSLSIAPGQDVCGIRMIADQNRHVVVGTVVDSKSGKALEGTAVYINAEAPAGEPHNTWFEEKVLSSGTGEYRLSVAAPPREGKLTIAFRRDGYKPFERLIGASDFASTSLVLDPVHLEPLK